MASSLRRRRSQTDWRSSGATASTRVTVTTERPVREVLTTSFSSGSSWATFSTLSLTRSSTRSGLAPGKVLTTVATLMVYGGILSRDRAV